MLFDAAFTILTLLAVPTLAFPVQLLPLANSSSIVDVAVIQRYLAHAEAKHGQGRQFEGKGDVMNAHSPAVPTSPTSITRRSGSATFAVTDDVQQGDDVEYYTQVTVGTPATQAFGLQIDSGSS